MPPGLKGGTGRWRLGPPSAFVSIVDFSFMGWDILRLLELTMRLDDKDGADSYDGYHEGDDDSYDDGYDSER